MSCSLFLSLTQMLGSSTLSCPPFYSPSLLLTSSLSRRWQFFFLRLFLSLPRSFLTSTDKENMFTMDHFPLWYRRAAENPAGQFLYYMPRQETRGRGQNFTVHRHTHTHTYTQTQRHTNTEAHKTLLVFFLISLFCRLSQKSLSDRLIFSQPAD